jgi:hypothetical protein
MYYSQIGQLRVCKSIKGHIRSSVLHDGFRPVTSAWISTRRKLISRRKPLMLVCTWTFRYVLLNFLSSYETLFVCPRIYLTHFMPNLTNYVTSYQPALLYRFPSCEMHYNMLHSSSSHRVIMCTIYYILERNHASLEISIWINVKTIRNMIRFYGSFQTVNKEFQTNFIIFFKLV